jgi:uncharacterized protein (DUF486 family)
MLRAMTTVVLLFCSNCFMTWAWYGHLKKAAWTIPLAIGVSWLIALPEYVLQVPANRIGHVSQGGPFTAAQLKVLQEAITLCVFVGFAIFILKERPRVNEYIAFALIFAGVAVAMLGRAEEPPAGQIVEAPAEFMVPAVAPPADGAGGSA